MSSHVLAPNLVNTIEVWTPILLQAPGHKGEKLPVGIHMRKIHVPSNHGGRLVIRFLHEAPRHDDTTMTVFVEKGPSHSGITDKKVFHIDPGKRGKGDFWLLVAVGGPGCRLSVTFSEHGVARESDGSALIPWNFWYFPMSHKETKKGAWGDDGILRPLHKYEKAFGRKGVVDWEKNHHGDLHKNRTLWAGHCHLSTMAAIAFEEPPAEGLTYNGVHFLCEELKLLLAEYAGNAFGWKENRKDNRDRNYWNLENANLDKDGVGKVLRHQRPDEAPEVFGTTKGALLEFLDFVRKQLRDAGEALVMDFRDADGLDDLATWNQAVFQYRIHYWQQRVDDLDLVEGRLVLDANADEWPAPVTGTTGMPATPSTFEGRSVAITNSSVARRTLRFRLRFSAKGTFFKAARDHRWWSTLAGRNKVYGIRYAVVVYQRGDGGKPERLGNPLIHGEDILKLLTFRKKYSP